MNVIFAPRALRDLEAISAYLAERSPTAATKVMAAIKSSIDALSFFPRIGLLVDQAGHRRLPISRHPYVVFYRVADDDLLILHNRHTSRRPLDPGELR
jgi:toxin ParE1/3/4